MIESEFHVKTPDLYVKALAALSEQALFDAFDVTYDESDAQKTSAELAEAMRHHDAIAPTVTDPMGRETIEAAAGGPCKLIANFGVGVNHIDIAAAHENGMQVSNTPGVLTDATADIALTLMLMTMRRAGEGEREVRADGWTGWRPTHLLGQQMTGKTLGIIGMGRIGKATAARAALGFGMKVVFYNRSKLLIAGRSMPNSWKPSLMSVLLRILSACIAPAVRKQCIFSVPKRWRP